MIPASGASLKAQEAEKLPRRTCAARRDRSPAVFVRAGQGHE